MAEKWPLLGLGRGRLLRRHLHARLELRPGHGPPFSRSWSAAHASCRIWGSASIAKTGRVGFRGENPSQPYAADGQCGTVLKCYREHLMSKDGTFLKEHWPKIKQVMEYEIGRDRNDDGVIEDNQWNTFDLAFVGPNTFVGALYLAALEAAARMADLERDPAFAKRCRSIAAKGSRWTAREPVERRVF